VVVDWDDETVDWSSFTSVIIRSTWNYHRKPAEFAAWIDRVSAVTRLHNPAEIVQWNLDKRYLADVQEAGFTVIATRFVEDESGLDAVDFTGDVMVKPTVSAGSNDTARFTQDPGAAREHARSILESGKAVMVQPYLSTIDAFGETGMLYFNGVYSHAFRKGAIFAAGDAQHNGLYVEEDIGERVAADHERALGDRVVAWIAERFGLMPLYARVDVVSTSASTAEIMEIELIEPSLFLHTSADAPANAARAIDAVR
jgi:hypothetical protein